jgi:hypothetical protein
MKEDKQATMQSATLSVCKVKKPNTKSLSSGESFPNRQRSKKFSSLASY